MRKRNRGFVLTETLVVSTFVLGTLVAFYTQFVKVNNSYERSFKYNLVEDLYLANNYRAYALTAGINNIIPQLETKHYIDLTDCNNIGLGESYQCINLVQASDIKTVLLTKEDTTLVASSFNNTNYSDELKRFVKYINSDKEDGKYRLIIEFNNDTFASIKINL